MKKQQINKFSKQISLFKVWASSISQKNGEWETEYIQWEEIYKTTSDLFVDEQELISEMNINKQFRGNLLFILARDNECENILQLLILHSRILLSLADFSIHYSDMDARWQIAYGLGEINIEIDEQKRLLGQFLNDPNEYVKKRAEYAFQKLNLA